MLRAFPKTCMTMLAYPGDGQGAYCPGVLLFMGSGESALVCSYLIEHLPAQAHVVSFGRFRSGWSTAVCCALFYPRILRDRFKSNHGIVYGLTPTPIANARPRKNSNNRRCWSQDPEFEGWIHGCPLHRPVQLLLRKWLLLRRPLHLRATGPAQLYSIT